MEDEEFLKKYEELLNKDYCNCNEMNCIDNNTPRRILNICKKLQQELSISKERLFEYESRMQIPLNSHGNSPTATEIITQLIKENQQLRENQKKNY